MKKKYQTRLEMTSLMDVMFLVLVFFIYCIFDMAVHKGLKVDLPNAAGAGEKGERIVITIKADDSIQLNGMEFAAAFADCHHPMGDNTVIENGVPFVD